MVLWGLNNYQIARSLGLRGLKPHTRADILYSTGNSLACYEIHLCLLLAMKSSLSLRLSCTRSLGLRPFPCVGDMSCAEGPRILQISLAYELLSTFETGYVILMRQMTALPPRLRQCMRSLQ